MFLCLKQVNIFQQSSINSTYLMLEKLVNLKSGVRYYVANYKNDQDSTIQLNNGNWLITSFYCLNFFFCNKGKSSKNNKLLSNVIKNSRSLTKFVNSN